MHEYLPYFEIKEIKEDGTFQGVASVYGQEDLGGDVIDRGAMTKTIAESPVIPILWQHQSAEVVGEGTVKEWQGKVLIDGKLDLEDPIGLKAYRKIKSRLIKGLSIGFSTLKSSMERIVKDGTEKWVRHIQELKLWEVSIVTFPMLPSAQVTRVKNTDELVQRINSLEERFQALSATQVATPAVQQSTGAGAGEGAAVKADEPEYLHSAQSVIDLLSRDRKD